MRRRVRNAALCAAALAALAASAPRIGGFELEKVGAWPRLPEGWKLTKVSGIAVDSRGRVYVAHRGEHPLLCFDEGGKFLAEIAPEAFRSSIAYNMSTTPPTPMERLWYVHGLHVDPADNVWVTDVGRHTVMKFSPAGKLLMTVGVPDKSGESETLFNQPTHVWVAPAGHFYVTDGYGNSRVVKFAADGKFLKSWGRRGTAPGEFHTPHSVTMDAKGNVYVTDRENNRIQVFDQEGKFLAAWPNLRSVDSVFVRGGVLYAGAGLDNKILRLDLTGAVLGSWGPDKALAYPHGIFPDARGNLYVAEVGGHRATKFRIRDR